MTPRTDPVEVVTLVADPVSAAVYADATDGRDADVELQPSWPPLGESTLARWLEQIGVDELPRRNDRLMAELASTGPMVTHADLHSRSRDRAARPLTPTWS